MLKIFKILDVIIATINKSVAVFGIAAGTILTFVNVVMRYCFNSGFSWAGELTNYLFIWSAFFGAAYGFNKGIHISITILVEKFPPALAKACMIFASILTATFLLFLVYNSFSYLQVLRELEFMSVDLNIPQYIPMLVIPIAFLFAGYRATEKVFQIYKMDGDQIVKSEADHILKDAVQKD
ncbi:TRAP transporter small permease [Campylobacter gastrosuis]|uniref:TRAP transporter small permease n=1 Tax=Campylobacter gastrosuis TaxID=2974576 RepID=A0ABT7HSS3_9BACT|nr:TRAP transporter small permease [Campylobacter gastrosuis]MDL0089792.1 TRAP transporter small permease [Campylobacter gastrosuis]